MTAHEANGAYTRLGARIAGNRAFCGYTQRQLADMCNVHFTYISKIESGNLPQPPSRALLDVIGQKVHIEPHELYILAGSFDADKLHSQALENPRIAALLLMIENEALSTETLDTFMGIIEREIEE